MSVGYCETDEVWSIDTDIVIHSQLMGYLRKHTLDQECYDVGPEKLQSQTIGTLSQFTFFLNYILHIKFNFFVYTFDVTMWFLPTFFYIYYLLLGKNTPFHEIYFYINRRHWVFCQRMVFRWTLGKSGDSGSCYPFFLTGQNCWIS